MSETKVKRTKKKMNRAAFKEHCWGLAFVSPPFIGFLYFHGISYCVCFCGKFDQVEWYEQHDG